MPRVLRVRPAAATPLSQDVDVDDATLVALAKQDRQAFAPLYHRYIGAVYRYCDRCLGNRELAEDAASQIFTKALSALPACRDETFRSWLFTIAHNVIVDMHRRPAFAGPLVDVTMVVDRSPERSPEAQALASEDARTIRSLLAQLPANQRQLLELRLAGLTDAEIARVLGRSHGAVRTSQHRAIARLRTLVGVVETPKEAPHGLR